MAKKDSEDSLSSVMESLHLSDEKVKDIEEYVKKHGVGSIGEVIDNQLTEYKIQKVNIAVTGQAGTGKSSLINTLRNLKPKEANAAKVGPTECTTEPTPYQHPDLDNVLLWDLPGANTPSFPKDTYHAKTKLSKFDCLIICSAGRFLEIDLWLAEQAHANRILFYFVRTKIDTDVQNVLEDDETASENSILQVVRNDTKKSLEKCSLPSKNIFLISTKWRFQTKWDFPRFIQEIVQNTPQKNRAPLIMGMVACSENFIDVKESELKKRIQTVALKATASEEKYGTIVQEEIQEYDKWFGISRRDLLKTEIDLKKLDKKLLNIREALDKIQNENLSEITTGRNVGKWALGIGYFIGKIFDDVWNQDKKIDYDTRLQSTSRQVESRTKSTIQVEAELILLEVLGNCAELARGMLQERKKLADNTP